MNSQNGEWSRWWSVRPRGKRAVGGRVCKGRLLRVSVVGVKGRKTGEKDEGKRKKREVGNGERGTKERRWRRG